MNNTIQKYSPWSLSKLTVADTCGLRFKWQYIEKRKQAESEDPRGRIGAAVHEVLEIMLKGSSDYKRALKVASVNNKLTTSEVETLMESGPAVQNFLKRIEKFKSKYPVKQQDVERRFALTSDLEAAKFFGNSSLIRGVFDLVLIMENGTAIIMDHKTGNPKPIEQHRDQLQLYTMAGFELIPEITGIQCAIHYTKDSSIVWDKPVSVEKRTSLQDWFFSFLEEQTQNIVGEEFEPQKNWLCGFCGYQKQGCPLWSADNGEEEVEGELV